MRQRPTRARRILRIVRHKLWPARPTAVRVRVFLNSEPGAMSAGYRPGAPLSRAYTWGMRADHGDTDSVLLKRIFAAFNDHPMHDDDYEHTRAWYARRYRSLSVGDVVGLDDCYYACQSTGWAPVPAPPSWPRRTRSRPEPIRVARRAVSPEVVD